MRRTECSNIYLKFEIVFLVTKLIALTIIFANLKLKQFRAAPMITTFFIMKTENHNPQFDMVLADKKSHALSIV